MKVLPFKIPKSSEKSFIYQEDNELLFYDKLHAHEEIQVSIVLKGRGELVAGDSVSPYQPGNVFVFGANLPHLFKSDPAAGPSFMQTLFFTERSFGSLISELKENKNVSIFFALMNKGLRIDSNLDLIKRTFGRFKRSDMLSRTILFFEIFDQLLAAKKVGLSSLSEMRTFSENEGKRMADVIHLALSEFQRDIRLAEIADKANMSPNAFCRYFKQRTNKTFFEFLLDIRLENACKLLRRNKSISISEISERSGFRNLSHFNRKFKLHKKVTPSEYRKRIKL